MKPEEVMERIESPQKCAEIFARNGQKELEMHSFYWAIPKEGANLFDRKGYATGAFVIPAKNRKKYKKQLEDCVIIPAYMKTLAETLKLA